MLMGRFSTDPEARKLLVALETGALDEAASSSASAEHAGGRPGTAWSSGLFAGVGPDAEMVRRSEARQAGIQPRWCRTAGASTATHDMLRRAVRRRRHLRRGGNPQAGAATCTSWAPSGPASHPLPVSTSTTSRFNLNPPIELGMATVHHTSAKTSVPELEGLLGTPLA